MRHALKEHHHLIRSVTRRVPELPVETSFKRRVAAAYQSLPLLVIKPELIHYRHNDNRIRNLPRFFQPLPKGRRSTWASLTKTWKGKLVTFRNDHLFRPFHHLMMDELRLNPCKGIIRRTLKGFNPLLEGLLHSSRSPVRKRTDHFGGGPEPKKTRGTPSWHSLGQPFGEGSKAVTNSDQRASLCSKTRRDIS